MINVAESERDRLYRSLRAELLGPRQGPTEIIGLGQDPHDEYVTGILGPPRSQPEIEADERLSVSSPDEARAGDEKTEEDEEPEELITAAPGVSPALDPRSLPSSLGLSFIVAGQRHSLDVLCTWARYQKEGEDWHRVPINHLLGSIDLSRVYQPATIDGVEIRVLSHGLDDGSRRVSIHMINTGAPSDRVRTEDLIFQPQIRVVLDQSLKLVPLSNSPGVEDDTSESELAAWRSRLSYARGHLCSALWREIDIELDDGRSSAYRWIDGDVLPEDVRTRYTRPHVRTEYIPAYEVRNPDFTWTANTSPPVLSASGLAQAFDPVTLSRSLTPLVDAYRAWIATEREELVGEAPYQEVDVRNLDLCAETADRISDAIDLLCADADARLAFCFANQAIALQSEWQGVAIEWRPFQLAFILLNIPAIASPNHSEREICDLLYFPTGGGKTEAYLALMAFAIAHRRLVLEQSGDGAGTTVISRYTLRLLTIQQFRRTARLVAACEYLRVQPNHVHGTGWLPSAARLDGTVWGGTRFSIGLWVGGGVTPNGLVGFNARSADHQMVRFLGAIDLLKGARIGYTGPDLSLAAALRGVRRLEGSEAEPAQLLECPACAGILAVPEPSISSGVHRLHFVIRAPSLNVTPAAPTIASDSITAVDTSVTPLLGASSAYKILSITIQVREDVTVRSIDLDRWFFDSVMPHLGSDARLECVRPSRMGYFVDSRPAPLNKVTDGDFAIFCPSPDCPLQVHSGESVPVSEGTADGSCYQVVPPPFRNTVDASKAVRIPITAFTVDQQVYRRVPSIVIATVDKFARLTDDPEAASLFGHVNHYHARLGFYREGAPAWVGDAPATAQAHPPDARGSRGQRIFVEPLAPPSLIVQDELHLIDGPLGSMVGAFETVTDALASERGGRRLKYIASTATVSHAEAQIRSVFDRGLRVFPPVGRVAHDNFFLRTEEGHPSERTNGRLYLGISAIGRGPQTPMVRIWSRLLKQVGEDRDAGVTEAESDPYWTAVGYFNAIRELAAGRALLRADIPQRMGSTGRQLQRDAVELSGRTSSLELPRVLDQLAWELPKSETVDALVTTSMFGTGIDISRLGLMIVHGQPKTTSAYIQATGRVGRTNPALVVTFLRASRPRDLDHYEFFTGYHRALGRWVEPVTVAPFASRTCERVLGPLQVALLRQAAQINGRVVSAPWHIEQRLKGNRFNSSARLMVTERTSAVMNVMAEMLEARAASQPVARRPPAGYVHTTAGNELDRWRLLAQLHDDPDEFVYREPAITRPPTRAVVLGDPHHREADLDRVFEDAPTSLREVEGTLGVFMP